MDHLGSYADFRSYLNDNKDNLKRGQAATPKNALVKNSTLKLTFMATFEGERLTGKNTQ